VTLKFWNFGFKFIFNCTFKKKYKFFFGKRSIWFENYVILIFKSFLWKEILFGGLKFYVVVEGILSVFFQKKKFKLLPAKILLWNFNKLPWPLFFNGKINDEAFKSFQIYNENKRGVNNIVMLMHFSTEIKFEFWPRNAWMNKWL
jgi:hypothetical protein